MSNAVIDCLLDHRSVRRFQDRPVEEEKLRTILEAGARAATGGNLQLYSFLVVDDEARKTELDEAFGGPVPSIRRTPVVLISLVDLHRVGLWLKAHSEREICLDAAEKFFLAQWDALIALQNAVVAAESLGLGTCYVGSVLEMDLHRILGTPKNVFPAGMVCMGYPETRPERSMRLPLEAVVHRNAYHEPDRAEITAWYAERDRVWERVSSERKQRLASEGIHGIAQALAVQKFSPDLVEARSRAIMEGLRRAGFRLG